MTLYRLVEPIEVVSPTIVVAFDTWVDAGQASTTAVEELGDGSRVVAEFDPDALFDYRARRPPLEIRDGRLANLTWPAADRSPHDDRRPRPAAVRRSGARFPLA